MKKLLAIVLIGILVLNTYGYYGIFIGMRYKNSLSMMKAIDSDNYDESQIFTIKVAISIPYMYDQSDFVRVDGNFEHQGELYRLVKQRYVKDTLTVVCLKDAGHKNINNKLSHYVKTFAPNTGESAPISKIKFNFLKDYISTSISLRSLSTGWERNIVHNSEYRTIALSSYSTPIGHPPENL